MPHPNLFAVPGVPTTLRLTVRHRADVGPDHYELELVTEVSKGDDVISKTVAWPDPVLEMMGPAAAAIVDAFVWGVGKDAPDRALRAKAREADLMSSWEAPRPPG